MARTYGAGGAGGAVPHPSLDTTQPGFDQPRKRAPIYPWLVVLAMVLLAAAALFFLLPRAGSFLVIDRPQPSDVIVVLEGSGTVGGYARAVDLMRKGYAGMVLLAANSTPSLFGRSEADLARNYLHLNRDSLTRICPITATTLYAEAADIKRCLDFTGATSVILVTTDFQTRRAVSIFRKRLPQYSWSVATPSPIYHFAEAYWKYRAWTKTVFQEWQNFLWWKLVEQWRSDVRLQ